MKEEYDTKIKTNNEKLDYPMLKFVNSFLNARDLHQCIVVSKNFNKAITKYLDMKKKKIIHKIQNPNQYRQNYILHNDRDHYFFPFTIEFSKPQFLLIYTNNKSVGPEISLSDDVLNAFYNERVETSLSIPNNVFMGTVTDKIIFSPSTNTIWLNNTNISFPFNSVSTIQFVQKPFSVITFKYEVVTQKVIKFLHMDKKIHSFVTFGLKFTLLGFLLIIINTLRILFYHKYHFL